MAASGMYPKPVTSAPRVVALPQQKKIMEDVLDCVIQLKSEFFENHQPINDDNITLQRLCAKLEHLIQIGMREKTSLLGRKKDYWDYLCDCLGSAKGFNDGIRYVKTLKDNKTSLGRGRAFIRFCLVHQRLADALQQCLVTTDKTSLWFVPSSVLCNQKEANTLISALYDLNAMHFDLAPRGYDLDADWPSFSNRKTNPGGSWNIPISRRSSITSMDTISQASISLATSPEVDRLHRDLEAAQVAHSGTQEMLGALQKEKEGISQSAWESQGKAVALQEQLDTAQTQLATLQERHRELDVSFVKLKLEKDHVDKLLADERKMAEERECKRVQQLQGEEEIWKREMREEGERRRKEIDRLQEDLRIKTEEEEEGKCRIEEYCACLVGLMGEYQVTSMSQEDFVSNVANLRGWMTGLKEQLSQKDSEASHTTSDCQRLTKELDESRTELERVRNTVQDLNKQVAALESKLEEKGQEMDSLHAHRLSEGKDAETVREEIVTLKELNQELKDKGETLKELNKTMKERMVSELSRKSDVLATSQFGFVGYLEGLSERDERGVGLQQQILALKREVKGCLKEEEEGENRELRAVGLLETLRSDVSNVLKEREEKLRLMLSDLQVMEVKCSQLEKEVEMLEHGGQALNERLSVSDVRVHQLSVELEEEKGKVEELTVQIQELSCSKQELEKEKVRIAGDRQQCVFRIGELNAQKQIFTNSIIEKDKAFADMEVERDGLKEQLMDSQNEVGRIKEDLCMEREKVLALTKDFDGEKDSKTEILSQISSLQAEREEMRRHEEEIFGGLKKEKEELVSKVNTLQEEKEKLVLDMESMKEKVDEWEKAEMEYLLIVEDLNSQLIQAVKHCEVSLKTNLKKQQDGGETEKRDNGVDMNGDGKALVSAESSNGKDLNSTKISVSANMKNLHNVIKDLCESQARREETTQNELSQVLEEEKERLVKEVDAALEETHHIKSQLEQTSQLLTASNSSLDNIYTERETMQAKLSEMTEETLRQEVERDEMRSKMAAMEDDISRHESEKDELRREMVILKCDCDRAEDDAQDKLRQKRDLELRLAEIEGKLEAGMGHQDQQSEFSQKVLEESLADAQSTIDGMKADRVALEEKCSRLESDVKMLQDRSDGDVVTSLKQELETSKAHYELEIDTLQSEISALQFQMSSAYIQEQADLQTDGYSMTGTLSTMEELQEEVKQLEEDNDRLRKWKEEYEEGTQDKAKQNEFVLKIESLEEQLKGYEMTMMEMETSVNKAESSRADMSQELTQLQLSAKRKLEERDKEMRVLKEDNDGLKRQLLKLIQDKDRLWHKTDALVSERKRQASERWQDNSKVTHCGKCKAEFSIFLRKHHCRLCGRIFCWACSDHWLDTAHSSKKARVCQSCFDEKMNPDASLMGTSLIDNDSDNDDDDDDDSIPSNSSRFLHTCNSEGNVEIRQVVNTHKNDDSNDDGGNDETVDDGTNETDEGKLRQCTRRSPSIDTRKNASRSSRHASRYAMDTDCMGDSMYNADAEVRLSGGGGGDDDDDVDDSVYQMITQAEVAKTMTDYTKGSTHPSPGPDRQTNLTTSLLLSADELEAGEVNRQNDVWIRPGRQFGVPISIADVRDGSVLAWEFSSQPKDVVFSIKYSNSESTSFSDAEEIVSPCKCDAHRQLFKGELTPKRPGVYTLVFDNTYSRMTSKKVHYYLTYRKSS